MGVGRAGKGLEKIPKLLSRWEIPFWLCTGGELVPAICSSFNSDFLSWNCRNDNKEPAYLIWQLVFLSVGKYLILSLFFFCFLAKISLVWAVFSISLLTLDKEEQIPSNTCIFAFFSFPYPNSPSASCISWKFNFFGNKLLLPAGIQHSLAHLAKPCWNQRFLNFNISVCGLKWELWIFYMRIKFFLWVFPSSGQHSPKILRICGVCSHFSVPQVEGFCFKKNVKSLMLKSSIF